MTRTEARELIMQLLFQMESQQDYGEEIRDKYLNEHFPGVSQRDYALELIHAAVDHLPEIDRSLAESSHGWTIKRMPKTDLAIGRTAVAEILYLSDVPDAVSINEAVNMAKKFSTEESRAFINGVLGRIVKQKNA